MRVGRREHFWRGNCIAMGLSSGFVEPLESTGIFIIQRGLALLLSYFPDSSFAPHLAQRYNERMAVTYEEIRDFILLHYVLTQRTDTDFWKAYRNLPLPDTLSALIEAYDATGLVEPVEHAMFPEASWYSIFAGQNRLPRTHHRGADLSEFAKVRHIMGVIKNTHNQLAATFPTHREFIEHINRGQEIGQPAPPETIPDQR